MSDTFGADLKRSAVQSAPAAAGGAPRAWMDGVAESPGGAPDPGADETPYGFLHKDGCA